MNHSHHQHTNCCTPDDGEHNHDHLHDVSEKPLWQLFIPAGISLLLLLSGLLMDYLPQLDWFEGIYRLLWYLVAYLPVGLPVIKEAFQTIAKSDFFSEFFLMSLATLGAFYIGEYPEGVAVMLFYAIGEIFQSLAVNRAKANIKSLIDQRPDQVTVLKGNTPQTIKAENAEIGDVIQLKPGEKLALDGILFTENASFNTAALTGESVPETKRQGETVLAGMINLNSVCQVKVTARYTDSKLSKILELVKHASSQKAPTELFIRKFAKIYTPAVVFLAIGICLIPALFVENYSFNDWLYRALIFLVISCPCALVISIPLGYFGGIGAASRNGILCKGSNYLDILATVKNVVLDKTGTLTEGVFKVHQVHINPVFDTNKILQWVNCIESHSNHPVATAIHEYVDTVNQEITIANVEEIAGQGMRAEIEGKEILVGNFKLLDTYKIPYSIANEEIVFTTLAIAFDKTFVGYITIADQIKTTAPETIKQLQQMGITPTMMSGDKNTVVQHVARELGINQAFGNLLPEEKIFKFQEIKNLHSPVAFVGDGLNDAPVIALSDVGIAMGGLGSDTTLEVADVVIQDDNPLKIATAIRIGKQTKKIVWQNIGWAFGIKVLVLILGAGGLATMWEAVFADVGVALLAILNAVRIQRMSFEKTN